MRYVNPHFTYLLTYLLTYYDVVHEIKFKLEGTLRVQTSANVDCCRRQSMAAAASSVAKPLCKMDELPDMTCGGWAGLNEA